MAIISHFNLPCGIYYNEEFSDCPADYMSFFVINLLIAFKISPTIWLSKLAFYLNDIDIHLYFLFEFNFFFQTYIFLECGHIVKDNVLI